MSLFSKGDRVRVRGNSPATKMRGQTGVVRAVVGGGIRIPLYDLRLDSGTRYDAWEDEIEAAPSKKEKKVNIKKEDEIKIDPETGLPELPEGHRWRVSESNPYGPFDQPYRARQRGLFVILEKLVDLKVTVTEPNPLSRWWNLQPATQEVSHQKKSWKTVIFRASEETSADSVLEAARELFGTFDRERKADAAREGLIGVYPPKKLEVEA